MAVSDELDAFDERVAELETSLGGAEVVVSAFDTELKKMQETITSSSRTMKSFSGTISRELRRAFDGMIFDGMKLSDALKNVMKGLVEDVYDAALKPVQKGLGMAIGHGVDTLVSKILPFEKGASFSQGRVMPFAKGGVVSGPTNFPMRGGVGLMGEAGPEAILPLTRGADGRLGVASSGGGDSVNVTMNITTPDITGFQRSQSQIAAQMSRAISRGQRNR